MAKVLTRQSNIELLRLICILMITVHHIICHGITMHVHAADGTYMKAFWAVNGFLYIGVNVFILISGYFGIKFKWRKVLDLYLTMAFYGLIIGFAEMLLGNGLSYGGLKETLLSAFLPFSHSGAWFIECYILLMLLSPILNVAIENLDRKRYTFALVLLCIINLYFGFFWKLENSGNIDGFALMQFVWLYFIGGYIKRFVTLESFLQKRYWLLGIYIGCSVIYALLSILGMGHHVPHWDGWKYNNPILVISSIAFFMLFLTLNVKSLAINHIAASVFSIYIVQDYLNKSFNFYRYVGEWCFDFSNNILLLEYLWAFVIAALFVLVMIIFDQSRKTATKPLLALYDKFYPY